MCLWYSAACCRGCAHYLVCYGCSWPFSRHIASIQIRLFIHCCCHHKTARAYAIMAVCSHLMHYPSAPPTGEVQGQSCYLPSLYHCWLSVMLSTLDGSNTAGHACMIQFRAARCYTRLLVNTTPKGVVFSVLASRDSVVGHTLAIAPVHAVNHS